jgi:hypothetical protein
LSTVIIFGEAPHCAKSLIHFPLPRSFQRIRPIPTPLVTFRNKTFLYCEELLAPRPTPKLDHPLSAIATAYSLYSQLTSISGGRLSHLQPDHAPCCGDGLT